MPKGHPSPTICRQRKAAKLERRRAAARRRRVMRRLRLQAKPHTWRKLLGMD